MEEFSFFLKSFFKLIKLIIVLIVRNFLKFFHKFIFL